MGLSHVVVTSVDRDDLPDRGAGHYAATIRALKRKLPAAKVEILTPDFLGVEEEALATVLAARPEVFNHNIETVRRLHARMRGAKASYDKALRLLARAKEVAAYPLLTKSGIIVGLGETNDEVVDTMRDLRDARRRRRDDRPVPAAVAEARDDRPLGAPGRVPLAPRAGRGARLRLGVLRAARALVVPRGRAAPRGRDRPRRSRLLENDGGRPKAASVTLRIGSSSRSRASRSPGRSPMRSATPNRSPRRIPVRRRRLRSSR